MKILLAHTGFFGDLVLSTPVIGALKILYPDAELWVLTTVKGEELFRRDPAIAGILQFDKRGRHSGLGGLLKFAAEIKARNFDVAYSLHRSFRTALLLYLSGIPKRIGFTDAWGKFFYTETRQRSREEHAVIQNLHIIASELRNHELEIPEAFIPTGVLRSGKVGFDIFNQDIHVDHDSLGELRLFAPHPEEASDIVGQLIKGKHQYTVIVPGSVWATKRWSAAEFRKLTEELLQQGENIVIVGEEKEKEIADTVASALPVLNLTGKTTLSDLLLVIERAKQVVCNDSMALHVASAFKVPTVVIYCATSPRFGFGPWRNTGLVVERKELYCKPCGRHGGKKCPTGTRLCMDDVPASVVLKALKIINDGPAHTRA